MAFLPAICRHLLGEELKLPSVPTWWCGRDEDWSYVQAHFDDLVIRPAIPSPEPRAGRHGLARSAAARTLAGNGASAPHGVRGPGPREPFDGPRVRQRRGRGLADRPAGLCRRRPRRDVPGHARRSGPCHAARARTSMDQLGRPESPAPDDPGGRLAGQGRLGPFRPAGLHDYALAPAGRGRGTPPQQQRLAQPRGRQPVLARPAHRAGRRPRAAPAHRRHAHDQRTGAVEPAGNEGPGADAGRRRPAASRNCPAIPTN